MHSHPPLLCQRTSSDVDRESRGVFRVLHDNGLGLDCTYDRPELRPLNTCSERPLRWLWRDKIPLGKLTLLEGPPAVGKLFVALDIAARVSTGALRERVEGSEQKGDDEDDSNRFDGVITGPPDTLALRERVEGSEQKGEDEATRSPEVDRAGSPPGLPFGPDPATPEPTADLGQSVVLICDSWQAEDVIAPRLRMLGADQSRIVTFTEVNCTDQCGGHKHSRPIRFPLDRPMFAYILRQHRGCRLIVIDNLENYCESPRQLRRAIQELDETANLFGVAIVATWQGNVRFQPDGTIRDTARTIDGPARCIWCLTPDAAHPGLLRLEPKRMAFCKRPEGIACRISDAGTILWEPLPPYENPPTAASQRKEQERVRMRTWLEETLGTGVVRADTIYDAGSEQGFSKKKLIDARNELGARTFKIGFDRAGAWLWTMKPDSEITDAEVQVALLGRPKDFPLEPENEPDDEFHDEFDDEPEVTPPGEEDADEEDDRESVASAAQESENFGVLNENGRKMAGSRSSATERKGPRRYADLTLAQLREAGLRMLVLPPSLRDGSLANQGRCKRNGHSSNGHVRNGE